jgi:hypothetical protein
MLCTINGSHCISTYIIRIFYSLFQYEKRNACRILVGQPEGKRRLGRPICRWVDNIKIDLREIGWDGMGWYGLD